MLLCLVTTRLYIGCLYKKCMEILTRKEVEYIFANGSRKEKIDESTLGFMSKDGLEHLRLLEQEKHIRDGVQRFKELALGSAHTTSKSLDQMAELLYQSEIVDSIDKGKELVLRLDGLSIVYRNF